MSDRYIIEAIVTRDGKPIYVVLDTDDHNRIVGQSDDWYGANHLRGARATTANVGDEQDNVCQECGDHKPCDCSEASDDQ